MLNNKLKELRKEKELTQKQVAEYLRVDTSTVRKWELGLREPNLSMLVKLADFFEVSTDFLLGRKDY